MQHTFSKENVERQEEKKWHKNNSSKSNGIIPIPQQHKTVTKRHYWLREKIVLRDFRFPLKLDVFN